MQVPGDTQSRRYVCLPEHMIYGWIFPIRRKNGKALDAYKLECYQVLYNHFHSTLTRRRELIREKADITIKRRYFDFAQ